MSILVSNKTHILDLSSEALAAELDQLHMPKFRTKQIQEWIFQKRASSFEQMTNLSLADRQILGERFAIFTSEELRKLTAPDGTEKILLSWPTVRPARGRSEAAEDEAPSPEIGAEGRIADILSVIPDTTAGETPALRNAGVPPASELADASQTSGAYLTETVMIPCDDDQCDEYGNTTVAHRRTVCLSTQVGCPVQCKFCASGLEGLKGHLSGGQIIEQALRLQHTLPPERRLTNVVFMGMGEPLANLNATVQAIKTLMAPWGFAISGRKITVSTVGLPPQMKRLADLELPITLAISLHAPNDVLRRKIIPWAHRISLDQIIDAGRYYFDKTGRELTLEYIMLDGVNTLPEHARQLAAVAKQLRANVNLIYFNEVPGMEFKRPSGITVFAFQNTLRGLHVNCHIRKSRGREIAAACGQLARQEGIV
ncbi:MAG: 23S rRNA (adenine(2503)-C(2))-methyltransferase RlmN [Phycisphaerae bacterium]